MSTGLNLATVSDNDDNDSQFYIIIIVIFMHARKLLCGIFNCIYCVFTQLQKIQLAITVIMTNYNNSFADANYNKN